MTLNSAKYLNLSGIGFSLCTYVVVVSGFFDVLKKNLKFLYFFVKDIYSFEIWGTVFVRELTVL